MKTVKKTFKSVSLATIIFCAAATTALAGQSAYSHNIGHGTSHSQGAGYRSTQQVQTNHNGTSVRYQTAYTGAQASHSHGTNGHAVQASHTGTSGRAQTGSNRQTSGNRHHQVFSF